MIIRHLHGDAAVRSVDGGTWTSRRLLLAADGMGFSFHDTLIHAGTETRIHYKHHLESVYCIHGEGELIELDGGRTHAIAPGMLYALDRNDPHLLRARTELRLLCVFNPPIVGDEVHGPDGAYPASGPASGSRQ